MYIVHDRGSYGGRPGISPLKLFPPPPPTQEFSQPNFNITPECSVHVLLTLEWLYNVSTNLRASSFSKIFWGGGMSCAKARPPHQHQTLEFPPSNSKSRMNPCMKTWTLLVHVHVDCTKQRKSSKYTSKYCCACQRIPGFKSPNLSCKWPFQLCNFYQQIDKTAFDIIFKRLYMYMHMTFRRRLAYNCTYMHMYFRSGRPAYNLERRHGTILKESWLMKYTTTVMRMYTLTQTVSGG